MSHRVAISSFLRHEVFILGVWLGDTLHWRISCLSSWRRSNLERPVRVLAPATLGPP